MKFVGRLAILGMLAAVNLIPISAAHSAEPGTVGLAVSPPTFELNANPGDRITNSIRVDNLTDSDLSVSVDRRNFVALGEEGQAQLVDEGTSFSLASWIVVSPASSVIPAKGSKTFSFNINLPRNAEPGGHFGSIVFKTQARPVTGQSGIAVGQELGTLIFMRVAGDVKQKAEIESFASGKKFYEFGPIDFDVRIRNSGNVHFKPTGNITIANVFGKTVASVPVDPRNVLPDSTRHFRMVWNPKKMFGKEVLFGKYTATVSMNYAEGVAPLTATTTFIALPYKLVAVAGIFLLLLLVMMIRGRKRLGKSIRVLFGRD